MGEFTEHTVLRVAFVEREGLVLRLRYKTDVLDAEGRKERNRNETPHEAVTHVRPPGHHLLRSSPLVQPETCSAKAHTV